MASGPAGGSSSRAARIGWVPAAGSACRGSARQGWLKQSQSLPWKSKHRRTNENPVTPAANQCPGSHSLVGYHCPFGAQRGAMSFIGGHRRGGTEASARSTCCEAPGYPRTRHSAPGWVCPRAAPPPATKGQVSRLVAELAPSGTGSTTAARGEPGASGRTLRFSLCSAASGPGAGQH